MSITYTYEIIKVDQDARCMEVVYSSEGNPTMHVGARLPFEGEALEDVIAMFAPVPYWESLKTPVVVPAVGTTGVLSPVVDEPTPAPLEPIFPTQASGQIDSVVFE